MVGRHLISATRPGGPDGSINAALRSVRQAAGMSLHLLAARTNFSKPYLSNVESGRRRVTVEIAEAYDAAFGTGGLLVRLLTGVAEMPVGRARELAEMQRLHGALSKGQGNVLWVEGEPGIGKSMLLRAGFAETDPRVRAVWATADESLARFPLWVLLDQIRLHDAAPELAEITGLLRNNPVGVGSGDPVVAAAERLVMLIERWCVSSPVLLVLDDLQWADEMSLAVWGRLRRLVGQLPLLLAGSCRPVPRRPEVLALRRTITEPDGVLMSLAPLARGAVTDLTGRLAGAPPGARLQAAADQAGGNPLYLRELVDALRRDHRIQLADRRAELAGTDEVPSSLKAAIGTRLTFLSEDASSVLRLAALLGPEPTIDELTAVTGRPA